MYKTKEEVNSMFLTKIREEKIILDLRENLKGKLKGKLKERLKGKLKVRKHF